MMASRHRASQRTPPQSSGLAIGFELDEPHIVGVSFAPLTATMPTLAPPTGQDRDTGGETVDSWLVVDPDGYVTIYSGKVELGTGVRTALAQLVADELDVPFDRVSMVMGDTTLTPDEGGTTGSKTLQNAGPRLRQAAAEARLVLMTRAAERLGIPADQLRNQNGVVSVSGNSTSRHPNSGSWGSRFRGWTSWPSSPVENRSSTISASTECCMAVSYGRVSER
jgi:CO/xanthine dehydrogenase Mo-binding subunit